jgi:hypothetical protein
MAFLKFGVDQTYEYFHCGPEAATASLMAFPTAVLTISDTYHSSSSSRQPTASLPSLMTVVPSSTSLQGSSPSSSQAVTAGPGATDPRATPNGGSGSGGSNLGAIIGGVIGGLALLCVFGGVVVYLLVKARLVKAPLAQVPIGYPGEDLTQFDKTNRGLGGWGPSELAAHEYPARSPVELPVTSIRL